MDENFVIHTPLMWLNKAETWKMADDLGAFDFVREKTLTCYKVLSQMAVENVLHVSLEKTVLKDT